jgi:CubicO group peptidase (beta-lactamase class C family)
MIVAAILMGLDATGTSNVTEGGEEHWKMAQVESEWKESLAVWTALGHRGEWAELESSLKRSIRASSISPSPEARENLLGAYLYLHEAYIQQGKVAAAGSVYRLIRSRFSTAERRSIEPILLLARERTQMFERAGIPKSATKLDLPWTYRQLKAAIHNSDSVSVSKLSSAILLKSALFDRVDATAYVEAAIGLIFLSGKQRNEKLATATYRSAKRLLTLMGESPPVIEEDLEEAYKTYVLKKRLPQTSEYRPAPDPFWPSISRFSRFRAAGISEEAYHATARYIELCRNTGADTALVVWRGRIIGEWYSRRYHGEPLNNASSTKSILSYLVGILVGEGKIGSVYDPVEKYLPGWGEGLKEPPTIYNLLTMTAGIVGPFSRDGEYTDGKIADLNSYVVQEMRPDSRPRFFEYSNYAVQLLSPILEKVSNESLHAFARNRLLNPLSIGYDSGFALDAVGGTIVYGGFRVRSREFARLGSLVLSHGKWRGKQIVPKGWIEALHYPVQANDSYSLLWWISRDPTSLAMRGSLNNNCVVVPSSDLILVRQQKWDWSVANEGYHLKEPEIIARLSQALRR